MLFYQVFRKILNSFTIFNLKILVSFLSQKLPSSYLVQTFTHRDIVINVFHASVQR